MDTTDRIVVVAAGFGVWQAGRHLASARWTDVVHVRALARSVGSADPSGLALRLRDGTEIRVHETLPGFVPFLTAAETTLLGMRRRADWLAAEGAPDGAQRETVLFERYPPKA